MILFRLISFALRVVSAFIFVFILQIRWDQKPLEHYFIEFAQSFFVTKVLNQVSDDGIKVIRHLSGSSEDKQAQKKPEREISSVIQEFF